MGTDVRDATPASTVIAVSMKSTIPTSSMAWVYPREIRHHTLV